MNKISDRMNRISDRMKKIFRIIMLILKNPANPVHAFCASHATRGWDRRQDLGFPVVVAVSRGRCVS